MGDIFYILTWCVFLFVIGCQIVCIVINISFNNNPNLLKDYVETYGNIKPKRSYVIPIIFLVLGGLFIFFWREPLGVAMVIYGFTWFWLNEQIVKMFRDGSL